MSVSRNERSLTALVTDRGRITLPARARRRLEIEPGDELVVVVRETSLELIPLEQVAGDSLWLLTRRVRAGIEDAEDDLDADRVAAIRSARSVRRAVDGLQSLSMPNDIRQTEIQLPATDSTTKPPLSDASEIDSLILTRQFAAGYDRLRPNAQRHCDRTLKQLLVSPHHPGVRFEPVPSPAGYHVLRFGFNDRAIVRFADSAAILIDVFAFMEVARWNARAARRP